MGRFRRVSGNLGGTKGTLGKKGKKDKVGEFCRDIRGEIRPFEQNFIVQQGLLTS